MDPCSPSRSNMTYGNDYSSPVSYANPRKLYVGNLPTDSTSDEIRLEFERYGPITLVECRGKYAFVEYERQADAVAALHRMNGQYLLGEQIHVQRHNPASRAGRGPPSHQVVPPPPKHHAPNPTGRERRTHYRVLVYDLDEKVSWQDLKDFGRNAGDVNFANVFNRDGQKVGIIEYYDDRTMERALERLHKMRLYDRRVHIQPDRGQLDGFGGARNRDVNHSCDYRGSSHRPATYDSYTRMSSDSRRRYDSRRSRSRERSPPRSYSHPPPSDVDGMRRRMDRRGSEARYRYSRGLSSHRHQRHDTAENHAPKGYHPQTAPYDAQQGYGSGGSEPFTSNRGGGVYGVDGHSHSSAYHHRRHTSRSHERSSTRGGGGGDTVECPGSRDREESAVGRRVPDGDGRGEGGASSYRGFGSAVALVDDEEPPARSYGANGDCGGSVGPILT